jgi:hypothetical protein
MDYRLKSKIPYVIAIEGEGLGSCKSLSLVVFGAIAHHSGYKIYTNMESLKLPHKDFYTEILPYLPEYLSGDMKMPQKACYLLDDVNKVAESRRGMRQTEIDLSQFMQDVRKAHSFFAYSIPVLIWTEARFYDVTDIVIDTAFDQETETVYWTLWDPMVTKISGRRSVVGRWAGDARPIYQYYDSWEKINRPRPEQMFGEQKARAISEYACKTCGSTQVRTNQSGVRRCVRCGYSWAIKVKA